MSQLNRRLQLLIDLLPPSIILADIGTDHGYLPIESIKQGKASYAYASDINQQPLDQAKKNIQQAKLTKQIETVLSDGLTYFNDAEIKLDFAIIAGLGSSTIVKILNQDTKLVKNYLVCSNTDPLMIRQFIKKQHWFVSTELFFLDNHRKYWILKISKVSGKKIKTRKDLFLGTNENEFKNEDYLIYLKNLYEQNLAILKVSKDKQKNRQLKRYNRQILKVI